MNDRPVFAIRELWPRAARPAVWTFVLALAGAAMSADLAGWRWQQTLELSEPGLIKIELSTETLDAARADQGDLRLFDPQGAEVPYVVDQSEPSASVLQRLEQMEISVRDRVTVLEFTNSLRVPLESVMVETPVPSYIKSVTVDVAAANRDYVMQSAGQFVFRQPSGAHRSTVKLKVNPGERVRLTFDDARSQPIPLTGLQLQGAAVEEVAPREHPVTIARREEASDESRLLLDFGARHLQTATLKFTVTNPVFARTVSLISRVIEDGEIKEQLIARGTISRGNGRDSILDQTISVEARLPQRELWLAIRNEDSPPLKIDGVTATVRPAYLIFQAAMVGSFTIYTGNAGVASPKYDITRLRPQLKSIPLSDLSLEPLRENPDYRPPETLADVPLLGSELDVSEWIYRKEVILKEDGIQELELDLEVLAHARPELADLRLLQAGRQVPYIVERSPATRPVVPKVDLETDAERPSVQRWKLSLPVKGSPVNRLKVMAVTPLFQRDVRLYEWQVNGRGEPYRHDLGRTRWTRTPEQKESLFALSLDSAPITDTLILEVDNGDNPPLVLQGFELTHPVTRILFKAETRDQLELYYGQGRTTRPRYDLTLMGRQVLQANRKVAALGIEHRLREESWQETPPLKGLKGVLFWAVLILVVAGLLIIVIRLLPRKAD